MENLEDFGGYGIAIVGMANRVPGATNPDEYWHNLKNGIESVKFYEEEDLAQKGVTPDLLKNPNYVKAGCPLNGMDQFDPDFFGFSPKEAAILDPQHRHFYECAWEALERAGHPPSRFDGAIGVFAGSGTNAYFAQNLITNSELMNSVGHFLLRHTGNDKDFLSTRISYCFNMKGPAINVQTACSTSSVATHLACQSLLSEECDMALAGGVTIDIPHGLGYLYKEGEILSPDGHCRPFDHRSKGTIFGSGTGVIVLRRLEDAIRDGDHIHAVIIGSAVNNDGNSKVGYLAPSVEGQAEAITEALAIADVDADSIGYVECHGTGTPVGDPIEVAALTEAFNESTERTGYCGLGSVKSNIGHLDTAAGVSSLIKATLALENKQLPPSLNYEAPNPTIDFVNSPFFVNDSLKDWKLGDEPRRAGVNSLGVGGTNAFVILEEAPTLPKSCEFKGSHHLISFSAKSRKSLDAYAQKLAKYLKANPDINLADATYTLFEGREHFENRRVLAAKDTQEAIELLESLDQRRVFTHSSDDSEKKLVFMFPGGGAQYVDMGKGLYETEAVFKKHMDEGFDLLKSLTNLDYKDLLFAEDSTRHSIEQELQKPGVQLPLIFLTEYALAKQWMSMGVKPDALIGHSMGENTAACLAGVLSFKDAMGLVLLRGQLMDEVPEGGMLSVELNAKELEPYLDKNLALAAKNSPMLSVASGKKEDLATLSETLSAKGIENKAVNIDIAAHSHLLDGILQRFEDYLRNITLHKPNIKFISNFTGTWITDQEATDPEYWVKHLRNTVRFADGIESILSDGESIFLEVGPGQTLGSLTRQNPDAPAQRVVSSLRHPKDTTDDAAYFQTVFGRLWAAGLDISAAQIWPEQKRHRIPLPTYAFNHNAYFIEKTDAQQSDTKVFSALEKITDKDKWYRKPIWIEQGVLPEAKSQQSWLVFMDEGDIGEQIVAKLQNDGHEVVTVHEGDAYFQESINKYRLSPEVGQEGYSALVKDLVASNNFPNRVLHLWSVTHDESFRPGSSFLHRNQEHGFYSLFFFARALADADQLDRDLHMLVYTNGMQQVKDEDIAYPEKATVLGPCKVIPREFANVTISCIDLEELTQVNGKSGLLGNRKKQAPDTGKIIEMIASELYAPIENGFFAYRNGIRWMQVFDQNSPIVADSKVRLKTEGVYLITGGLGGIGYTIAQALAEQYKAKLVLVNRTPLPSRKEWADWLKQHDMNDGISKAIMKVRELEEKGANVLILSGDVTDVGRMKDIISEAENRFGQINGVIHGAGTVNDGLIQMKGQADIEEVFAPKIYGTRVLDEIFETKPLDFFIVFSSTSTVIAPVGQIDYVAANAYLNAFAQQRNLRQPGYTVALNWGVWNEVGMAASAASQMGFNDSAQVSQTKESSYPLFDSHQITQTQSKEIHYLSASLSSKQQWVLDEHRTVSGQALLPGTAYIELARAGLEQIGEKASFDIRELIFLQALYVPEGQTTEARIKLVQTIEGYDFAIQSLTRDANSEEGWQTHAEARIVIGATESKGDKLDQVLTRLNVSSSDMKNSAIKTLQEKHLNFGPRWHVLRSADYAEGESAAALSLDDSFADDLEHYKIHPALLDIATGYAMSLIKGYESGPSQLWVPVSYGRFSYHKPLTQRVFSWVKNAKANNMEDNFASFDIRIFDEAGNLLVEVNKLTIKRLEGEVDFSISPPAAGSLEKDESRHAKGDAEFRQMSPAELAFQHNLSQGILPTEGVDALISVVNGCSEPEIIVSSLELEGLIKEVEATAASNDSVDESAKFSRPDLDNDYIEPRDDIEKSLVGFWEDLLGVDQVGVEDNFFDLGGHSLIAVRLFAKIQQAYGVDYPISVLFEAPTIAACAEMLREVVGDSASSEVDTGEAKKETTKARYRHLVPMHSARNTEAQPFFLVAGMFGNVLNLRHLAQLVGSDRPFYGLQARGLLGEEVPHETFEEAAKDYIQEMLTVQTEGPFTLGGFSGGGITAYEIARQLMEMGHEVAQIIFLDTPLPYNEPLSSVDKMSIHWQRIRSKGVAYFSEWATNRYYWELNKFKKRFGNIEETAVSPAEFKSGEIEAAFYRALGRYDIKPLAVKARLFRPKLPVEYYLAGGRMAREDKQIIMEDNGWPRYIEQLQVFEVPGDHDSMVLEPNVRVLANKMRSLL